MRIAIIAALSCLPAVAAAAPAVDEVRTGLLLQGLGPFSPNKEEGVGVNGEVLFNKLRALKAIGAPRPHFGLSVATGDYATSQVYAGLTWRQRFASRFFIDGGVGVAIHNGETNYSPPDPLLDERNYLGCRAVFRLSADLGVMVTERLSASIHTDHLSNANLCSENEGLDNTGLRVGYKF